MVQLAYIIINSLVWAAMVFLVSSGLTLIYGILRILNFAHGVLAILGAYVVYTALTWGVADVSLGWYILVNIFAVLVALAIGFVLDRVVFVRLYGKDHSYSLIATYGLMLVVEGFIRIFWGANVVSVNLPKFLNQGVTLGNVIVPLMSVCSIIAGGVVYLGLVWVVHQSKLGKLMNAAATDDWMYQLLGRNARVVLTITAVIGVGLAGVAGIFIAASQGLDPAAGDALIIEAFGVVIIGGLGKVHGALIASLILGLCVTIGDTVLPEFPGVMFYIALIIMILMKRRGSGLDGFAEL